MLILSINVDQKLLETKVSSVGVVFVFNLPPTAKIIWRPGHSLKSHPTDWWSRESNLWPLVYKASGLSTTPLLFLVIFDPHSSTVNLKSVFNFRLFGVSNKYLNVSPMTCWIIITSVETALQSSKILTALPQVMFNTWTWNSLTAACDACMTLNRKMLGPRSDNFIFANWTSNNYCISAYVPHNLP